MEHLEHSDDQATEQVAVDTEEESDEDQEESDDAQAQRRLQSSSLPSYRIRTPRVCAEQEGGDAGLSEFGGVEKELTQVKEEESECGESKPHVSTEGTSREDSVLETADSDAKLAMDKRRTIRENTLRGMKSWKEAMELLKRFLEQGVRPSQQGRDEAKSEEDEEIEEEGGEDEVKGTPPTVTSDVSIDEKLRDLERKLLEEFRAGQEKLKQQLVETQQQVDQLQLQHNEHKKQFGQTDPEIERLQQQLADQAAEIQQLRRTDRTNVTDSRLGAENTHITLNLNIQPAVKSVVEAVNTCVPVGRREDADVSSERKSKVPPHSWVGTAERTKRSPVRGEAPGIAFAPVEQQCGCRSLTDSEVIDLARRIKRAKKVSPDYEESDVD